MDPGLASQSVPYVTKERLQ